MTTEKEIKSRDDVKDEGLLQSLFFFGIDWQRPELKSEFRPEIYISDSKLQNQMHALCVKSAKTDTSRIYESRVTFKRN